MKLSIVCTFFLAMIFGVSSVTFAQKTKEPKEPTEKPKKEPKEKTPKNGKNDPKTDPKSTVKTTAPLSPEAHLASIAGLSREEKNTMTKCPMHGKHMSLSDNYRANASDFRISDETPFAYQLNYRRYCTVCTKNLLKEEKIAKEKERRDAEKATFQRCVVHNKSMTINGESNPNDIEKNPNEDYPNAQQYKFKTYCKACTKAYAEANKNAEKDNKSKGKKGK